ncbi:MAG: hypothetical protein KA100_06310 [Rickettsiales bacterium]|nr:hypothetical protein [Rickettsiales bacterium]
MPLKKYLKQKLAFSLIELAVVILIIAIFSASILTGINFYKKFRISTAQTLTISSPVNGISQNILWLESSLDESFDTADSSNNSPLNAWHNVSNQAASQISATASGTAPTYSNTINYIPAVKFDGSGYFNIDASSLNNSDYTIFILEKRAGSNSDNYFLGDASNTITNQSLLLGYKSDGTVTHSQSGAGATNYYDSGVDSYENTAGKSRIFTFTSSSKSGKKTYINGTLAAESANLAKLSNLGTLAIGKNYNGEIGEIIIFSKAVLNAERIAVEEYLSKKWSSKLTGADVASCFGGIVTNDGCTCAVGYSGENCSACDTAAGYLINPDTGTCQHTCTTDTVGIDSSNVFNPTSISTLKICDVSGYAGSINYTCIAGIFNPISGSCTPNCVASGGTTDTSSIPGSVIHIFNNNGSLTCSNAHSNVRILVAGGGGAGGNHQSSIAASGGGGGGVIDVSGFELPSGSFSVTIGVTRTGVTNGIGQNGNDSIISGSSFSLTAFGGGGGVGWGGAEGVDGGSGSGGHNGHPAGNATKGIALGTGSASVTLYGNAGGASDQAGSNGYGGGGGGATTAGSGKNGGEGFSSNISGTSKIYGSGGGGVENGIGGTNAGSGLAKDEIDRSSVDAANNSGGGGGGANSNGVLSGSGGSGVVIVRY